MSHSITSHSIQLRKSQIAMPKEPQFQGGDGQRFTFR
uniref:Uncharacterized protein n=1 Tax=Arundo donax TaxID=35708 RepID=A0A0A9ETZ3_ARUDO